MDRFGLAPGEDVPGDLDNGAAYLDDGLAENGKAVGTLFVGEEMVCVGALSGPVFAVMVRELDVALAAVVATCAVETSEAGEMVVEVLDFA